MITIAEIWEMIAPYVTGTALGAFVISIMFVILKGIITRAVSKINVEKTVEQIMDKTIQQIQNVSFKQSIQPLVESELQKVMEQVSEQATKVSTETLEKLQTKYDNVITILQNFANYFDDAISVTSEQKEALQEALTSATQEEEVTEIETQVAPETKKKSKKIRKQVLEDSFTIER